MKRRFAVCLAVGLLFWTAQAASAQTAAGWKTKIVGKNVVLTPTDLAAGEACRITIYPRTSLNGVLITDFLDGFADRTIALQGGKLSGKPAPATAADHSNAVATRQFTTASGQLNQAIFFALCPDQENARVVSFVCTAPPAVLGRYQAQMLAVVKEMNRQETDAAVKSGRGLVTEDLPDAPPGLTPGGPIVPGIYAGNIVQTKTINGERSQEIYARLHLYLYADGEFRLCHADGTEVNFGTGDSYYDQITGRLKIGTGFKMACFKDPANGYCLYGHDADGKPCLMARETQTFGEWVTVLHYVGPPDRLSPEQEDAKKAAADAEAARYKFVPPPGKGIQAAQIVGILHAIKLEFNGTAPNAIDWPYLLLKDGTLYDGLPVPPDEMDVPLSRRREPEKWGRWRRQGTKILAAWPDNPAHFSPIDGDLVIGARPGERLSGRYGTGSTSGSALFGGTYRLWGVTFTPDGRFTKDSRGGADSGTLGETLNEFSVSTTSDDSGSVTSFNTPGAVGYAQSETSGSSRTGTYSVSGYVPTLRYENGKVARLPFFFEDSKRTQLYFEGASLALDTGK